jgi:hypothetical protein
MDAIKQRVMDKFSGINNVDPATRLFPVIIDHTYVYPLQSALNITIDDTYGILSRPGYDNVLSGADVHSLWADGEYCFFVDGTILYRMDTAYTKTSIRTGLQLAARMSYVRVNDRIYYTNGFQCGYVTGNTSVNFPDPAREFKVSLPAGQLIDYYRGLLLMAKGNKLYISDPLCDYYDIRKGYRIFKSNITMVRPVDDGIYVSDGKVYFLKGNSNDEFIRDEVYPAGAVSFTSVKINGKYISDDISGNVAMWTGENGICFGDNSGKVVNLTEANYNFTAHGRGAAFIREKLNERHYINSLF